MPVETKAEPRQYAMLSTPLASAPGILRWAINGYKFKKDRKKMLKVVKSWEGPTDDEYRKLLNEEIPYTVDENNSVLFTVA